MDKTFSHATASFRRLMVLLDQRTLFIICNYRPSILKSLDRTLSQKHPMQRCDIFRSTDFANFNNVHSDVSRTMFLHPWTTRRGTGHPNRTLSNFDFGSPRRIGLGRAKVQIVGPSQSFAFQKYRPKVSASDSKALVHINRQFHRSPQKLKTSCAEKTTTETVTDEP